MKSALTTGKRQEDYQKRLRRRKLKAFNEYGTLKFSNSITLGLTLVLLSARNRGLKAGACL